MSTDNITKSKRENFSSEIGVFFVTLSSALGLGNIWRFPYFTGLYGGGAFLLVYVICLLLVGIPIMLCEFYIGRKTRKNSVGAFRELSPNIFWGNLGIPGVIGSYIFMFFYSCVAGWVYLYLFKAIKGDFIGATAQSLKIQFQNAVIGPILPIVWQIIAIMIVSIILVKGVKKGIERTAKILMPVLFGLIILCDIRALTLPGAWQGVDFLISIDINKLTSEGILIAMGLAFFKFSLGTGALITYSSYFTEKNNMILTAAKVCAADTMVSLMAGIVIFPAAFSFGIEPGLGKGLLFITIPLVFMKIPFGNILLIAFFLLTAIVATTAMMSMIEVPVAYLCEEKNFSRRKAVLFSSGLTILVGSLATLSAEQGSILSDFRLFGKTLFDFFDYVYQNILLLCMGIIISIFVGYVLSREDIRSELTNSGTLNTNKVIVVLFFFLRYISPILILIILLNGLGLLNLL